MAAYIEFRDRKTNEVASPQEVDEALCNHFGVSVVPESRYKNWFDIVGLLLAVGLRGEGLQNQIRAGSWDPETAYALVEVAEFIEEHYETKSWSAAD